MKKIIKRGKLFLAQKKSNRFLCNEILLRFSRFTKIKFSELNF